MIKSFSKVTNMFSFSKSVSAVPGYLVESAKSLNQSITDTKQFEIAFSFCKCVNQVLVLFILTGRLEANVS